METEHSYARFTPYNKLLHWSAWLLHKLWKMNFHSNNKLWLNLFIVERKKLIKYRFLMNDNPSGIYLSKVNNRNSRKACERNIPELSLMPDSHLPKQFDLSYLPDWQPFKNDEKCFLFHLKNSFCSQDI